MQLNRFAIGLACVVSAAFPQGTDWPTSGAALASSKYRPLDQINAANFSQLEIAWRFKTDNIGNRPEFKLEGTPLMVKGVVYATAGSRRAAIALDAKTGALVPTFGKGGAVDLKLDDDQSIEPDLITGEIGFQSAPVVARDTVIVGAAFREGMTPKSMRNNKGYVRGFDVRTGKRLWIFHTIPLKNEVGYDTWENGSAEYTGNTGVWTQISVDEQLGLVYLPVEPPTGDYYGGHRPGANLFGETLVCVDLKTGQRKWHFQLVHHPLWDMDISSAPLLADITVNGRAIKAVAQPTKQGFLYVFDRVTGKPVWPIEEKKVERGTVPGEWYSPTQPIPSKPPAYARNGISIDDLIDFTPALREQAVAQIASYKIGPVFTPPSESQDEGPIAALTLGTASGGTNWPGGSYDPETHTVYVYACNSCVTPISLLPAPKEV